MDALNIFLVDNDQYNLNLYVQYLGSRGYDQVNVFNNNAGHTIYLDQRPDVVFLGNGLGQRSGLELLKSFRSVDPAIDVILLPAPEYKMAGTSSTIGGVDNYVLEYMDEVLGRLQVVNRFIKKSA